VAADLFTVTARPAAHGIRIAWDHRTMKRVSHPQAKSSGYARMIQLRDKSLLCIYESDGSTMATKSTDGGDTWDKPVAVAWKQDGIHMAAPDVLELKDGSLLAMYNPRPWKISTTRNFGIRTRKSYDGGRTWIHGRLVHEAGHKFGDGCWEPAAIQMPDGEIRLFFADEGAYRETSEQNISMLRSRDGGLTWTKKPEVVSFSPGGRDGMPSPLLLQNGEVVVAIEDNGWIDSFKPAIIRTRISDSHTTTVGAVSPHRHPALRESIGIKTYAGAPYLRQLSTGETLLSYQGTEGRRNNRLRSAEMKVAIGNAEAKAFSHTSAPFPIPKNKFGLWNSLTVLDDDTVVAVTSTNAFSLFQSEVWMIKGRVIPVLQPSRHTLKIDGRARERVWQENLPISIGRDGQAHLEAGVTHDDKYLYVFSRVADTDISTPSANPEDNDGVTVSIAVSNNGLVQTRPGPQVHKIYLSADNQLVWKTGDAQGRWTVSGNQNKSAIRHASSVNDAGYVQEIALPWTLVGGKPEAVQLNISLTENSGFNVPEYRESTSGNTEDQPHTWMTVKTR
jgi:hypothetical protein